MIADDVRTPAFARIFRRRVVQAAKSIARDTNRTLLLAAVPLKPAARIVGVNPALMAPDG